MKNKSELFSSVTLMIPEIKMGDESAWNALLEKFRFGLLIRANHLLIGNRIRVSPDDLVQETFLRAWNGHQNFRGKTTCQLSSWLLSIQRNIFLDLCKSEKNKESRLSTWFEFEDGDKSPSEMIISDESEAKIHACLSTLEPHAQQILIYRHFEGLKFLEIAELMQLNPNSVASIYRRGVKRLSVLFDDAKESS